MGFEVLMEVLKEAGYNVGQRRRSCGSAIGVGPGILDLVLSGPSVGSKTSCI